MKITQLISVLVVSVVTCSCQPTQKTAGQTPSRAVAAEQKADEIIRDTVTSTDGVRLAMAFDNATHTARFVLKGESIELKQDTLASGITYSNPVYEFYEHQGEGVLKKGENILFNYKK
jgi:membrane-bound inhibitor of C-type lysozyme